MEIVFIENGKVVTDSLMIAEVFAKDHDKVKRDIKNQIKKLNQANEDDFIAANFGVIDYKDSRGRNQEKVNLTEDSFTLVVMSYTTPEAMKMKVKFIQEFKRMREYIEKQEQQPVNSLELALQAALKHEQDIKVIKSDVDYLKGSMRIDSLQQQEIQQTANQSVTHALGGKDSIAYKEISKKAFSAFWNEFKQYFKVPRYGDIPKVKHAEALRFIQLWRPSTTLQMEIDGCNSQMMFE